MVLFGFGFLFAVPMIQNLETTLKAGAVPRVPQFRPPTATPNSSKPSTATPGAPIKKPDSDSGEKKVKTDEQKAATPPVKVENPSSDPMGDARSKVQEEIMAEFAAIMASGTLRASEAAALATRRVMQRYGQLNVAMQQS